jgi:hypothetical protein
LPYYPDNTYLFLQLRIQVSFDEFCTLVSEYKNKARSSSDHNNHHAPKSAARENLLKNKTVHFFSALVQPVNRAAAWLAATAAAAAQPRSRTFSAGGAGSNAAMGRRGSAVRDVYLGGSSSGGGLVGGGSGAGGGWREQLAIPMLKKSGLTFYNPAVCSSRRLIPIEASAMDNSRVLLFAILGTGKLPNLSLLAQEIKKTTSETIERPILAFLFTVKYPIVSWIEGNEKEKEFKNFKNLGKYNFFEKGKTNKLGAGDG